VFSILNLFGESDLLILHRHLGITDVQPLIDRSFPVHAVQTNRQQILNKHRTLPKRPLPLPLSLNLGLHNTLPQMPKAAPPTLIEMTEKK
jgi:hypothetical protein